MGCGVGLVKRDSGRGVGVKEQPPNTGGVLNRLAVNEHTFRSITTDEVFPPAFLLPYHSPQHSLIPPPRLTVSLSSVCLSVYLFVCLYLSASLSACLLGVVSCSSQK